MDNLTSIFGEGKDLTVLQMTARGIVVFIISLILIRISGRRSFGIRTPADNIVVILLGALLSRAVAGVSPFLPIISVSFAIVLMHRIVMYISTSSEAFKQLIDGTHILLFDNGKFIEQGLKDAIVCSEDIMQAVRKQALTEDLDKVDKIYMECTGEISVVKKHP